MPISDSLATAWKTESIGALAAEAGLRGYAGFSLDLPRYGVLRVDEQEYETSCVSTVVSDATTDIMSESFARVLESTVEVRVSFMKDRRRAGYEYSISEDTAEVAAMLRDKRLPDHVQSMAALIMRHSKVQRVQLNLHAHDLAMAIRKADLSTDDEAIDLWNGYETIGGLLRDAFYHKSGKNATN